MLIIFILCFLFVAQVSAEESLVAEYHFDEGAGTTINDSSSKNNNGILRGSPKWAKGVSGTALDLNGADTYVEVSTSSSLDLDDATIEVWLYVRNKFGGISFASGSDWSDQRFVLHFYDNTPDHKLTFTVSNGKTMHNAVTLSASSDVPLNQWFHVAVTCDSAEIKIYLNGVMDAKKIQGQIPVTKGVDLIIGKTIGTGSPFFDGMIDEMRIYNRALTAEEIAVSAKKYERASKTGTIHTVQSTIQQPQTITTLGPEKYVLGWMYEPENGAIIISHSAVPSLYYKNPVVLSEKDFLTNVGLPNVSQKVLISKVSAVEPEFGYLTDLEWKNVPIFRVEDNFIKVKGVKVLAWAEVTGGNEKNKLIPIAISVKTKQNKEVIYFPWETNFSYFSQVATFRSVLEYLKRQGIDVRFKIKSSVDTRQDNMDRPGRVVTSGEELEQLILPGALCFNGQLVMLSINVSNGPLKKVKMETGGNEVQGALYSSRGFVAASVGKTFFAAGGQFCAINNRVYATTYELVPYAMSTMDGEEYHYTLGLDLLTGGKGNIYLMRPEFWANDELISAFFVEQDKIHLVKPILDKDIIQIDVTPGRYFMVYGLPESIVTVSEFWKWFSERQQIPRPDDSVPALDDIISARKMSNIVWITIKQ